MSENSSRELHSNEEPRLTRGELGAELRQTRKELNEATNLARRELSEQVGRLRQELTESLAQTRKELGGRRGMTGKDWLKVVIMPVLFILVGTLIGAFFQDRSFRKNTLFKTQYERLVSAQKETADQYRDLESLLKHLESYETVSKTDKSYCSSENFNPLIEQLKSFENRRLGLKDYSGEAGAGTVLEGKLNEYALALTDTIKCESGYVLDGCTSSCKESANKLRDALQSCVYAHNTSINDLIRRNN
ncbi:MAG TPA: hypothetical protein VF591_10695 [Pyrinomonadaceae bacterium]|jgi:hypothetical protein